MSYKRQRQTTEARTLRWRTLCSALLVSLTPLTSHAYAPSFTTAAAAKAAASYLGWQTQPSVVVDSTIDHLENYNHNNPHMYLSSRQVTFGLSSGDRFGGRALGSPTDTSTTDSNKMNPVLGFDVPQMMPLFAKTSSVDSETWNYDKLPQQSPIKNHPVVGNGQLFRKSNNLNWFPWIPTRAQIETLKVVELKEACEDRGLLKSGKKADLVERLVQWTQEQHRQRIADRRRKPPPTPFHMGLGLREVYGTNKSTQPKAPNTNRSPSRRTKRPPSTKSSRTPTQRLEANSLAEWARNVDVAPLRSRREAIRNNKLPNKKRTLPPPRTTKRPSQEPTLDYREYLQKAYEAPSSQYSNKQIQNMYKCVKLADQAGDVEASKALLQTLLQATPSDARLYRRLARLETQEGQHDNARKVLQKGLRRLPDNAYLWHGLGQLERTVGRDVVARQHWRRAIKCDPHLSHPYHALGSMEHSRGHISVAKRIFKEGLHYCPTNHRLHHALGDLYAEAKMLEMATSCYTRALEYSPRSSRSFAQTALAQVAYEQDEVEECRSWLRQSVSENDGRHAQGWVALAQMEEACGNIDAARGICIGAISQYERGLVKRDKYRKRWNKQMNKQDTKDDIPPVDLLAKKETLFQRVPQYRSGDKFIQVFRNWARLEETHGCPETVDEVYTRASFAFPYDWKLCINWAQYHAKHIHRDQARMRFAQACRRAKNRHADPYRLYAEYEMSFGNYVKARSILFRGAQALSACSDGGLGHSCGFAELCHTWAVCEWHLNNLSQSEVLLDHALRMTDAGEGGSKLRSFILYSIARLEYFRGEYELAQHCVALCLKENLMPGGNSKIWELWGDIASAMCNEKLVEQCKQQALLLKREENVGDGFSRLLSQSGSIAAGLSQMVGASEQPLMKRSPWHDKLFGLKTSAPSGFFHGVTLPEVCERTAANDASADAPEAMATESQA